MAKKEAEKKYFNLANWEVANVRKLDFGTFFTLKIDGASFYNMRIVPAGVSQSTGKEYPAFIMPPEEKGSDGKYYKVFSLYLDPKEQEEIIEEAEKQARAGKKAR